MCVCNTQPPVTVRTIENRALANSATPYSLSAFSASYANMARHTTIYYCCYCCCCCCCCLSRSTLFETRVASTRTLRRSVEQYRRKPSPLACPVRLFQQRLARRRFPARPPPFGIQHRSMRSSTCRRLQRLPSVQAHRGAPYLQRKSIYRVMTSAHMYCTCQHKH